VQRFRGGLLVKAHRLVYHCTLGLGGLKRKNLGALGEGSSSVLLLCARPVHLITTMIQWIRTSRVSINHYLSDLGALGEGGSGVLDPPRQRPERLVALPRDPCRPVVLYT